MRFVVVLAAALVSTFARAAEEPAAARTPKKPPSPAITFSTLRSSNRLLVATPRYKLALSRATGAVVDLVDRRSGTHLVRGQAACPWEAEAPTGAKVGGCSPGPGSPSSFTYRWDQPSTTLTLAYPGDGDASVHATVAVTARSSYFDLRLTLENGLQNTVSSVDFPADLLAASATVRAGYAPTYLPGIRLKQNFFWGLDGVVFTYPGRWAFADYLAYDASRSSLALYSVNPAPNPIQPVELGFVREAAPDPCSGPLFCIRHSFDTWIPPRATWTSPPVRVKVGQTPEQSVLAYRHDNGIDAYPTAAAKLGATLAPLSKAPLIKADLAQGLPFRDWGPVLRRLPSPALLHPVAFQAGGFDVTDPDFLPPDPAFGTSDEFRSAVEEAHALGQLVMPYLNTSWWSVESPTLAGLPAPLGVADVSVLNPAGEPRLEQYGDRKGYVVSPYAPYVRDRMAGLLKQWQSDVPVDCLFFDQIGARPWLRDFNSASPSPLAYTDGWVALLAPYTNRCLMVEDGWDRLAAVSVGFQGGLLLMQREFQEPDSRYGPGNWEPYPLALWLLHDKVLLYQHDLYEGTMTADPEVLTWNLAFGFMLSYNWSAGSLDSPWLDVAGSFQRALGPYYAGQPMTSYAAVAPGVTATSFGDYAVLANWSADPYEMDGDQIAPGGFVARTGDGALRAGAFSGFFDGAPLSPGTHYLVVERSASSVKVHQPLGEATELAVDLPSTWKPGRLLRATAEGPGGAPVEVEGAVEGGRYVFQCLGPGEGQPAPTYRISAG